MNKKEKNDELCITKRGSDAFISEKYETLLLTVLLWNEILLYKIILEAI